MRLLLITASSEEIKRIRKTRVINFQQVTMPYLAALTPPHWEVIHIDEGQEQIDYNIDVDLVGITFHTPSANYVYNISEVRAVKQRAKAQSFHLNKGENPSSFVSC